MKNKNLIILFFCLIPLISFSQNLVPNGSFEDTLYCPSGGSDIESTFGWTSFGYTPDYFNSCNNGIVNVPSNFGGFQYAEDGNAYAGEITYYTLQHEVRDYLGIQLMHPLTVGNVYYASIYISPAYNPSTVRFGIMSNNLGIKMSTIAYSSGNLPLRDNIAQLFSTNIISDTAIWTRIYGSFIADSAYNYLMIGNFFSDSLTNYFIQDSSALYAYYYFDDIRLSEDSNYANDIENLSESDKIEIFPNPARDWLAVRGNDIKSISISDLIGRELFHAENVISPFIINTSIFHDGVLSLFINSDKKRIIKKIIIQKK